MSANSASGYLYILEDGGEWPRWLVSPDAEDARAVIRQEESESPAAFAGRVASELAKVAGVGNVVVACSERQDEVAARGRREIGNAVLSHLARSGRGSLLFTESQRQSGGSLAALSALASELASAWEGSGVSVSVRFGQPSRPPQESVPPPPPGSRA